MDIIVTQIKQIGREILLDGNSVVGYQHSANLYVKLIKDTSADNPFADMALSAFCRSWKSKMPIECPIVEREDGTYILLNNEVFKDDGDVYLSLGGISEDKVIVTSNNLVLQVDESNSIIANVTPSEEYWQIEVLNAMKVWYATVVDPVFKESETKLNQLIRRTEEHEEKAEELQTKAEEQQAQVDTAITNAETATESANAAANNANDKATLADDAAQAATQATTDAQTATQNANTATQAANDLVEDISTKLANGELNGKDGKDGKDGELGGDTVPIGAMLPCTTSTIPDGWLLCDGSLISRTEYSELFAVIGESYGAGDGETTFALPNEPNPLSYTKENESIQFTEHEPALYMIIKAKQVVPLAAGITNDLESNSENDAFSAATVKRLLETKEVSWDEIPDKPSSFPPTTHKHTKSQITDFPSALKNPKALTFAGGATGSYDGSTAKTITIPTLTGITGIKLFSVTVKPNNVNYFDVARASNEYIMPLHLSIGSVWIGGIQYGSASVRVILNAAISSSITFTYMIVYGG